MSNLNMYYTPESMKDKKLSDLRKNPEFITDAVSFLKSKRKGYTDKDLEGYTGDDVVEDILEHFRYQSTNEISMSYDYNYIADDTVDEKEKQAYGRLLFAFDNAKGEGLLDNGGAKILDYAGSIATAPTTYASIAAGLFTGGAGGVAVQGGKQATLTGLRTLANKYLGRAALVGAIDGTIGAGSSFGVEKIKQKAGAEIGEDYDINYGNVALSGGLSALVGGGGYHIAQRSQRNGAKRLSDQLRMGEKNQIKELAKATAKAKKAIALAKKSGGKNAKLMKFTSDKILRAIDPALVEEGKRLKVDILSGELPKGLIAGLDSSLMQRLSAASYELASTLGVKPEPGQRITEYLARAIDSGEGEGIFTDIARRYGLTNHQLSAVYAAEVSEAARLMLAQKTIKSRGGATIDSSQAEKFKNKMELLFDNGMTGLTKDISPEELAKIDTAAVIKDSVTSRAFNKFKDIESARRAFMTSQPATTMRNNIFGVIMGGLDIVDQLNLAVVRKLKGSNSVPVGVKGTLENSVATFKYLTKDHYVADAVQTMLMQEAPEKLSKVFYEAAQAESSVISNSRWARAGKAANVLNTMSDHVFKKAVIAGTIDRELRALGNEALGKNLYDMLGKGTLSQLPDDILDKALDESLAFTFQRRFGGKGASVESKFMKSAVDFVNKSGLTVIMPFPRYMAAQAKFISDYTGLTLLRRPFTTTAVKDEEIAKAMTGAVTFAGIYKAQEANVLANREWFEAEGQDGTSYNAQAAMGPGAAHNYVVHQLARAMNGYRFKDTKEMFKDANRIVLGTEFRPNSGLVNKAIRAFETGNITPVFDLAGDYLSAFTYPGAVLKDFYGQYDPRSSFFPETRDATVTSTASLLDWSPFDLQLSTFQRATRQLPDIPFFSSFFDTSSRLTFQERYAKDNLNLKDTRYDMVRFDVFGDGPLRVENPLTKQLTGFVGMPPKNTLKRELTRLQLDPYKLYNPYKEKNIPLTLLTEQLMQGNLAMSMKTFIESPAYQNVEGGNEGQANLLDKQIRAEVNSYKDQAREIFTEMESAFARGDTGFAKDLTAYYRGKLKAMSPKEIKKADLAWSIPSEMLGYEGKSFQEIRTLINKEEDLTDEEKSVKEAMLIQAYQLNAKRLVKP